MESLRRYFNNQFQLWFEILVEDPALRVKVNENFTAQISRERDYLQLSGGERTCYGIMISSSPVFVSLELTLHCNIGSAILMFLMNSLS